MLFKSIKRPELSSALDISKLKGDVSFVREELEDHLQSINCNTNEIDIQNNFICEIDNRLTKMEERMDELHFLLKQLVTKAHLSVELSKDEQRVFLILYTNDKFLRSDKVASRAQLELSVAEDALHALMDKGIPIDREVLDGNVYFRLNNEFKIRQARENIIKLDPDVTGQFQNTLLKQFFDD